MGVTITDKLEVRKIILIDLLGDATFQSALHGIAGQIICARKEIRGQATHWLL
jgi:hypothetical protein